MKPSQDGKTILIVEDNPVNQKLFLVVLRRHGYRLLTAVDGEEALRVATSEIPDLILMDLQLPKLNGYAVNQRLKACPETAGIPVVALTAHAMQNDLAPQDSFEGFITKPIDTRAFPKYIEAVIEKFSKKTA